MVLRILKVKVKVALIVMTWMFLEKIRSGKTVLRILVRFNFVCAIIFCFILLRKIVSLYY